MTRLLDQETMHAPACGPRRLCAGTAPPGEPLSEVAEANPLEVEFILSALEAARHSGAPRIDRRQAGRKRFRVVAQLKLFRDPTGARPWALYGRDASTRGLGFITRHRLPLGYGGTVRLCGPDNQEITADCTIQRCRETVHGWFEGSLAFNREQWGLAAE